MAHTPVAVSAPGKVLLAGGYLVLDRAHTGLVFGLDARIHIVAQPIHTTPGVSLNEITVTSPQFVNAVWEYGYRRQSDGGINITQLSIDADLGLNKNPFIETALAYALNYIATTSSPNITPAAVTILADNDYYSTSGAATEPGSTRFYNFRVPLSQAHKTGLGSSAALVTSFTAAILSYYLPKESFDLSTDIGKRRLHNLAQAAHCAAQGKVGSGFDVASAVYGSCLYRRFSPNLLTNHTEPGTVGFAKQIKAIVDEVDGAPKWDTEIRKNEFKVPSGLRLVMCDVSCGSQTPGMVKKVLAWRKEKPDEADTIWAELQNANDGLAAEMKTLAESQGTRDYTALKKCFTRIRTAIRTMSEKSDVPIEPPSQTSLIDACEAIPGVLGGVVPGAGGYDAISLIIEDNQATVQTLNKLFAHWKFKGEANGDEIEGKVSMLRVREEMEGVRVEDAKVYVQEIA
ncbi:Hypothetical protein R9X50_00760800 [Acrodontium crateriforme]|uniref:Phosphomevalonate kinase n=1 Tax=Acrodontium crateriforme TaxID=150365 RepID=A0AAQ3MBM4_9PEZI|nr:Hypothetical protein R9X50_00760800 [Acrodontium crateriforme]